MSISPRQPLWAPPGPTLSICYAMFTLIYCVCIGGITLTFLLEISPSPPS